MTQGMYLAELEIHRHGNSYDTAINTGSRVGQSSGNSSSARVSTDECITKKCVGQMPS